VNDSDSNVRATIARNPKIQNHHLNKLIKDDNEFVRYTADYMMDKRGML